MTEEQRAYLEEHLPYMLKMLRYTYGQMLQQQHYLSWNAHFESFAVHARNLVNLLTNKDTGNFKAKDFVVDYKARIRDLSGAMHDLEDQVFHLGKRRPTNAVDKFGTQHAEKVKGWIEKQFEEFFNALPSELKSCFDKDKADPAKDNAMYVTLGPTGPSAPPSACTASPIAVQNQTTSHVKAWRPDVK